MGTTLQLIKTQLVFPRKHFPKGRHSALPLPSIRTQLVFSRNCIPSASLLFRNREFEQARESLGRSPQPIGDLWERLLYGAIFAPAKFYGAGRGGAGGRGWRHGGLDRARHACLSMAVSCNLISLFPSLFTGLAAGGRVKAGLSIGCSQQVFWETEREGKLGTSCT